MRRGRRLLVEGGLYRVHNRIARGEDVFADPEEAVEFSELLREVKQRDGLTIYAWALLSNHSHLAVRTSAVPLSRSMQRLQGGFAKRFMERWGQRAGQLAALLNKHPVAVSRWVSDAARRRQEEPAFGEEMKTSTKS